MAEDVNRLLTTAERRVKNLSEDIANLARLRDEIQQMVDAGAPNFSQADVDDIDTQIDNVVQSVQTAAQGLPTPWRVGVNYAVDDIVMHKGQKYRVAQEHTSQADWVPGEGTDAIYEPL